MQIVPNDRSKLVEAALGKRACDLVIRNARIVNMFTGEIYPGDVGIYDGFIAHIQADPDQTGRQEIPLEGCTSIDAKGQYLIPGLIDAHIHIESTMMTPARFAQAVIPHGTTTVVTDPHEIANVLGVEGVHYMHEASEGIPMRQLILVPSCVPSVVGKENSGAVFTVKEIEALMSLDRVLGLAEVMDYPAVLASDSRMTGILHLAESKGMFIQGHAPFLQGRELSGYIAAGPKSDHENKSAQELRDKMRSGMIVDGREGSGARNLRDIIPGALDFRYLDQLTLCTDDREPGDILNHGHMNDVVNKAVRAGLDPVDAIRCASFNIARALGLSHLGAIAPGYVADLVVTPSLDHIKPSMVFYGGKLVAQNQCLTVEIPVGNHAIEKQNTVRLGIRTPEDFLIEVPDPNVAFATTRVIEYRSQVSSTTDFALVDLPVREGYLDISHDPNLKYVAVLNRHGRETNIGFGILKNFGTSGGAVGSTVSHDCHNLIVVYDRPEDAALVVNELIQMGGGICCSLNGSILSRLALPVGGLMAARSHAILAEEAQQMKAALRGLGLISMENPLLRIAFVALAVIPYAKMTDLGMIDVASQAIMPMFV